MNCASGNYVQDKPVIPMGHPLLGLAHLSLVYLELIFLNDLSFKFRCFNPGHQCVRTVQISPQHTNDPATHAPDKSWRCQTHDMGSKATPYANEHPGRYVLYTKTDRVSHALPCN